MTLEQSIYEALSGHAPLTALVGTRIYPVDAPQASPLPRVVFARQETQNLAHLGGRGSHDQVQVAVMCFAETSEAVRGVASAVRNALDGLIGSNAIACARLIGRVQARVRETEADPGVLSDALLFDILTAET